jgi:hypothetical protein
METSRLMLTTAGGVTINYKKGRKGITVSEVADANIG